MSHNVNGGIGDDTPRCAWADGHDGPCYPRNGSLGESDLAPYDDAERRWKEAYQKGWDDHAAATLLKDIKDQANNDDAKAFGLPLEVRDDADIESPMEAVVVVKYLDSEAAPAYIACATPTLQTVEAIGMFVYGCDFLRGTLRDD